MRQRIRNLRGRAERWRFDHPLRDRDAPSLIVLGDSHTRVVGRAVAPLPVRASLTVVSGATAQGLLNPNSRTNALVTFQERIEEARPGQRLGFLLGEVDCGFLIWFRAAKYGEPVEMQLDRSLGAYEAMLAKQVAAGFEVLAISAPLPTIADGQPLGEVANERKSVTATQLERTQLTVTYNARLREICDRAGVAFVDATSPTLDPATGIVHTRFLNADPTDHHLDEAAYADVLRPLLAGALRVAA